MTQSVATCQLRMLLCIGLARTIYMYTVYIRYFWLGNHQIYGVYIRIYTVLASPTYAPSFAIHRVNDPTAGVCRVGQNRVYTPCMTVYLVILLPNILYIHRMYLVLANPRHVLSGWNAQCHYSNCCHNPTRHGRNFQAGIKQL